MPGTPIPFTDYHQDILERLSNRLFHLEQFHTSFSVTLSSGVTLAENIPLVTALIGIRDTQTAHGAQLVAIRNDLAAIKAKLGI